MIFWLRYSQLSSNIIKSYCVKSVHIQSYSGPYFPAFRLNAERYRASLRIQSECGKIRTRITHNTDTFPAVFRKIVTKVCLTSAMAGFCFSRKSIFVIFPKRSAHVFVVKSFPSSKYKAFTLRF